MYSYINTLLRFATPLHFATSLLRYSVTPLLRYTSLLRYDHPR